MENPYINFGLHWNSPFFTAKIDTKKGWRERESQRGTEFLIRQQIFYEASIFSKEMTSCHWDFFEERERERERIGTKRKLHLKKKVERNCWRGIFACRFFS